MRTLTAREIARVMGFPDTFVIPRRHNQAVRLFGNSVVVPLVADIGRAMIAALREAEAAATL